MKRAYSISNFCADFDIGRSKVYEEINSGRLKSVKVGRRRIITNASAEEWVKTLEQQRESE